MNEENKEKTKGKNNELKEEKPEIKSFKFYWFTPGTPKQIAYRGLIVILISVGLLSVLEALPDSTPNPTNGKDLLNIVGFLGLLNLLEALIVFIRNKIRKNKREEIRQEADGKTT